MRTFLNILATLTLALTQAAAQGPGQAASSVGTESRAEPVDASSQYVAIGGPIQMVPPKYPKHELKEHIQGEVVLRISVTKKGKVRDVSTMSGDPEFVEAATHAVRQWEFVPYLRNDQPVEALAKLKIIFKIDDTGHPEISAVYDVPKLPAESTVFKVGGDVAAPKLLYSTDPQYSEAARSEKINGTVELSAIVLPGGTTSSVHVTKSLRPDLDAKAVEAVGQWRFRPGTKDGKPVAVLISVQVQFHLF